MEKGEENPERNPARERNKLENAEYRLLGKGLKFCPKPKRHDVLQLKQDVFEFTRKLRLKEFFAEKERNNDDEYDGNYKNSINNSNTFHKKKPINIHPTCRA